MPGVEIKGMEELFQRLKEFGVTAAVEALEAAEDAAAKLVKQRLQEAAPVGSRSTNDRHPGQLRKSIQIVKYKDRDRLHAAQVEITGATQKILIGPVRKTGFYGYFQDKGWDWMPHKPKGSGRYVAEYQRQQLRGQKRVTVNRDWFMRVADTVEQSAIAAGERAAMNLLRRFL